MSVGVLVCFCDSFVVFDRLNAFVLVGILLTTGYLSFDFGSFRVFLALFCAICGLFTPKVEVSGKEGKIPLSCSELF